jgi:CheY-like chemotaxis protein
MCRVLIVDDNSLTRRLTRAWLQRLGQSVDEVADGATAFARLGLTPAPAQRTDMTVLPNVILLDMVLPDTDGWTILRAIRADARFDAVAVYCYSGTVGAGTELQGFDGTIAKSGSFERFRDGFSSLTSRNRASRFGACCRKPFYGDAQA